MENLKQRRIRAMGKSYEERTIEDWIVVLYGIYQTHNRTCGPYDLWLQVVNDASQLAETIRRQIIRTKFSSEVSVYTQLARIFCRISGFIGRYIYDPPIVGSNDSIGKGLLEEPLDDYIGGEERCEKWILLKYPYSCPTCGSCPCVCAAYRNIMEDRNNAKYDEFWKQNQEKFALQREKYCLTENGPSQETANMFSSSIDDWVEMFHDIYSSGHIEISFESIGFHFLEEIGEVSDGILCLDELFKYRKNRGVYRTRTVNLHQILRDKATQDPKFAKCWHEYESMNTGR